MKCCLCGKRCENQWGNNPWPLKTKGTGRCCNICNERYVILARMLGVSDIKKIKKYIDKETNKNSHGPHRS